MADLSTRNARIASVVAATAVALGCGTNYAYSAWGPDFAKRMDFSATAGNAIGAAGNVGTYAMGIPAGLLIDSRGPRIGVLVGAACLAAGYFPIYKAYNAEPGSYSLSLLCFCSFLTGTGSCTAFSGAIKTATYNWPSHRGTATAFPLSMFGLSAFIFTTIANVVFGDSTGQYLLTLAVGTTALTFIASLFIRLIPTTPERERPGFTRQDSNHLTHQSRSAEGSRLMPNDHESEHEALMSRESSSQDLDRDSILKPSLETTHPEVTGLAVLRLQRFWQLFAMLALLSGVGIMTINNIGNDAGALWRKFDPSKPRSFVHEREQFHVGVLSICSFLGRFASGTGSDYLTKTLHASRLWCLVVSACIFTLAQICALIIQNPNFLFLVSGFNGLAYGALFGVMPPLVADNFGVQGLSLNWGFILLAPVITGNLFNLSYGRIFDGHSKGGVCDEGLGCYVTAYWITLASSVGGILVALYGIQQDARAKRLRLAHLREA